MVKIKLLFIALLFVFSGCDTFVNLAKENEKNKVKSEQSFNGKGKLIKRIIKEKYNADYVNLGINGFFKVNWMEVSLHNCDELTELEEFILARAIYRVMDTSYVKAKHIVVSRSYEKGFILTESGVSSREYYFHELDPNILNQELEHKDRNLMESWRVGL